MIVRDVVCVEELVLRDPFVIKGYVIVPMAFGATCKLCGSPFIF